jgi:RHS repeat-associated protein
LYYLQSRYYDSNTGRFINADDMGILQMAKGQVLGANLFSYCGNNPINFLDVNGFWDTKIKFGPAKVNVFSSAGKIWGSINLAVGLLGFSISVVINLKTYLSHKDVNMWSPILGTIYAGVGGIIATLVLVSLGPVSLLGGVIGAAIGAIVGTIFGVIIDYSRTNKYGNQIYTRTGNFTYKQGFI